MARLNAAVGVETAKKAWLSQLPLPTLYQGFRDLTLSKAMGGKGRADRRNAHAIREPVLCGMRI